MRTRSVRWATAVMLGLVVLTGCSAAGTGASSSSSASSSSASAPSTSGSSGSATPVPAVSAPADGVSLAALGFTHGPVTRVFLPLGTQISSRVDQATNVALVLTAPDAGTLAAYLRTTLPANGFAITADDAAASTLTFAGQGWTGTFTGDARASGLLLRPAP